MSNIRLDRALSVDFELTCWENGVIPPGQKQEIIQIGLTEINIEDLSVIRTGSYYCKPKNSEVSEFCTKLTGIRPRTVKNAPYLDDVVNTLKKKWGTKSKMWFGWGNDKKMIDEEALIKNIESPFSENYINLSTLYSMSLGTNKKIGLKTALKDLDIKDDGKWHNAEWDSLDAANIYISILANQRNFLLNNSYKEEASKFTL